MSYILLVNDDGIDAPGIKAMAEVARELGEVVVIAPLTQQSAKSHSITIGGPLSYTKYDFVSGIEAYGVKGTPVDCVKMAVNLILKRKPDMLLSGINWGANHGASVFYSGTVAAAMEGAIQGIPSIAFSLESDRNTNENFEFSKVIVKRFLTEIYPVLKYTGVINVNIPNISLKDFKGFKLSRQAISGWKESYSIQKNQGCADTYHLDGELVEIIKDQDNDVCALSQNLVPYTPLTLDLTDHTMLKGHL